ncbi:hypothetical protein BJ508DRAFT_308190 [Ascobolus immersus RN42]|uniref:Uncharacterized protein n=1 Tax=Ascobolus immersus RN42 TaxID=1160509 RepID=A0A3N4I2A4_ASCIM|nr:hypothetical protein BJ508DRAFT_308190 [Ascobolus immersus RN42]
MNAEFRKIPHYEIALSPKEVYEYEFSKPIAQVHKPKLSKHWHPWLRKNSGRLSSTVSPKAKVVYEFVNKMEYPCRTHSKYITSCSWYGIRHTCRKGREQNTSLMFKDEARSISRFFRTTTSGKKGVSRDRSMIIMTFYYIEARIRICLWETACICFKGRTSYKLELANERTHHDDKRGNHGSDAAPSKFS